MQLYDNYEEDGQLSMFGAEEPLGEQEKSGQENGPEIRIRRCSSCGKLLFVREEEGKFLSQCNNCGIRYSQKK